MMDINLKLPLDKLRPVRIRELKESALCLSYDKRGIHILVDRFEEASKAILLNGEHAFHSFEIEAVHDWKGLAATDYEIVVDANSALDTENHWPPLGALTLGPDGVELRVAVKAYHGFTDEVGLKLGMKGPTVAPGLRASFTRWAFKFGDGSSSQFIWIEAKAAADG